MTEDNKQANDDTKKAVIYKLDAYKTEQKPWENEPDNIKFVDEETGLECYIGRAPGWGYLCGYVPISKDERKKLGDRLNQIKVHGGITSDQETDDGLHIIGFDCMHFGDLCLYDENYYYFSSGEEEESIMRLFREELRLMMRNFKEAIQSIRSSVLNDNDDSLKPVYRDIEYVKAECKSLAKQLHEMINREEDKEEK